MKLLKLSLVVGALLLSVQALADTGITPSADVLKGAMKCAGVGAEAAKQLESGAQQDEQAVDHVRPIPVVVSSSAQ